MAAVRKYLFENSFDAPAPAQAQSRKPEPEPEPAAPPEPTFSEAELAAARAEARAEGEQAGRAAALEEAQASLEQATLELLERLAGGVAALMVETDQAADAAERRAIETAGAVLRRLFPALAQRDGEAEILALIGECLALAHEEPRVVVRVADEQLDAVRAHLASLRERAGFEGRVVLLADAELGASDVRVEWADGGVERDVGRTWQEIEALLQRSLSAPRDPLPPNQGVE